MTNEDRIEKLEAQIDRLEVHQDELRRQLTKAQLDQWYGRIEDLELQAHLGAMETSDRINALVQQLRKLWADAKAQVDGAASAATDVVDSARTGIERAFQDIRQLLLDGKKAPAKRAPAKKAPTKRAPAKAAKKAPAKKAAAKAAKKR